MPIRTVDSPAAQAQDPLFVRYCGAVLAAWGAEAFTYPFDLTKTRLQIQSEVAATKAGLKVENHGMLRTALNIARQEGVLRLWGGLSPMLQRHAVYSGCRLVFYEHFRDYMKDEHGHTSAARATAAGVAAGSLAQFLASPTDLVKVNMQAEGRRRLHGLPPRFANCREAWLVLWRSGGLLGFWRGAVPNVQRAALVNIGDLAAYDYTKHLLMEEGGLRESFGVHVLAGLAAGLVAAVLGTPADVLKTRLMNQPVGPDGRGTLYKGSVECILVSTRNEGLSALYRGFLPNWIRLGPWAVLHWVFFEYIMAATGTDTI